MKAIVHHEYGPADEVLRMEDTAVPTVKDDGVLIRVGAAGVNWADWSAANGQPYLMRLMYGLRRPRNGRVGSDVAGTVEAVGAQADGFTVGDEVFGSGTGAFAELATAKAKHLVTKPAGITFADAAAIPMAGLVAIQAVRDVGAVRPGHSVLINGASGGIGSLAVQIAKTFGAEVTGVCSTPNVEFVQSIGADHVIDYTTDDFTHGARQYDLILDISDKHSLSERRRVLTAKGTLIPNSGEGGPWVGSLGRIIRARMASPFVSQQLRPFLSLPKQEDLVTLKDMIESGAIKPVVGRTFQLAETGDAVAYVGAGHGRGKTVVVL